MIVRFVRKAGSRRKFLHKRSKGAVQDEYRRCDELSDGSTVPMLHVGDQVSGKIEGIYAEFDWGLQNI